MKEPEDIMRDAQKEVTEKFIKPLESQFSEIQKMMGKLRNEPEVIERKSKNGKIFSLLSDNSIKVQCENKEKAKKYFEAL